jgi:hypothetical protein
MAIIALVLLLMPFFVAWLRHRQSTALAIGVYTTLTLLAPAWGTFPVPVMGYGASPILGYRSGGGCRQAAASGRTLRMSGTGLAIIGYYRIVDRQSL